MVHVFFSEGAAGLMKLHQKAGRIPSEDTILVLAFMLDQGDLQEAYDSPYRLDLIYRLYTQNGEIQDTEALKASIQQYVENVDILLKKAAKNEPIRIYMETSPADVSGYIFV